MCDVETKNLIASTLYSVDGLISEYIGLKAKIDCMAAELEETKRKLSKSEKRVKYLKKKLLDDQGIRVKEDLECETLVEGLETLLPIEICSSPPENITSGSFPSAELNRLISNFDDCKLDNLFGGIL